MKPALERVTPLFWLSFGFFGFPVLCFAAEMLGWVAMRQLGLWPKHGTEFGWGGGLGLLLGAPLGVLSALCAHLWRAKSGNVARGFALVGGGTIGGLWLWWMAQLSPIAWLGDFGFGVTPLIWAGALILFGILARIPRSQI